MEVTIEHRGYKRKGRGFTCKEIVEAGLSWREFAAMNLRCDMRRKTMYSDNVNYLKGLEKPVFKPKKKKAKPAPKNE